MTLIKSISGIRGTIGGKVGDALTPPDIVKFTAAYVKRLKERIPDKDSYKIVVGRDARISGEMVDKIVCGTLMACGIDVVNAGLASTPTVEIAVVFEGADGGIILTASHNPKQWNALKLLNENGEFLSSAEGELLLKHAEEEAFDFVSVERLGKCTCKDFTSKHVEAVLSYPLVDIESIYRNGFKVILDAVNSVGGIIMPKLLEAMGVTCIKINCEPTGNFAHNPEPLPEHLKELSTKVVEEGADLGISVDPDVDRLALICEDGTPFGEEYTLVAAADYILEKRKGATVSNLSSSRALKDITEVAGCVYSAAAVGEINVVNEMKRVNAVIGGEGNGGVIVPDFHYGRDALIGTALILSHIANKKIKASSLRDSYPKYYISKNKIELSDKIDVGYLFEEIKKVFSNNKITDIDGVKIDFDKEKKWVHLRKSNTEPIIRIYAEAPTIEEADSLAKLIIDKIQNIIK
ncbi:MAG TPA: phosphoglucosamine mutase [Bacteroidales bacterium]|nr:phosphoglucosamine mutase [Bacteroidales bacterium]HRR49170.1 phosphoglucosamine mutase [Bacteroidales bacterium]HRT33418.1 phosphoglucosamine mutase [Bacteroidales bacterium]HRT83482.1 phosphoglucosamine mutase [Bacteroidales bacterium]